LLSQQSTQYIFSRKHAQILRLASLLCLVARCIDISHDPMHFERDVREVINPSFSQSHET